MDPNSSHCIFCDQHGGLSEEHLWPEWMHADLVPAGSSPSLRAVIGMSGGSGRLKLKPALFKRQTRPRDVKLKVVCRNCNGNWMSTVETSAQVALRRLQSIPPPALTQGEQLAISRWAALRSIINQYTLDNLEMGYRIAIPYRDRMFLAHGDGLPEQWRVWIGVNDATRWKTRITQKVFAATTRDAYDPRPNSVSTMIGFGRTMIYTCRSPYPDVVDPPPLHQAFCLRRIWPIGTGNVELPSMAITDEMADTLIDDKPRFIAGMLA